MVGRVFVANLVQFHRPGSLLQNGADVPIRWAKTLARKGKHIEKKTRKHERQCTRLRKVCGWRKLILSKIQLTTRVMKVFMSIVLVFWLALTNSEKQQGILSLTNLGIDPHAIPKTADSDDIVYRAFSVAQYANRSPGRTFQYFMRNEGLTMFLYCRRFSTLDAFGFLIGSKCLKVLIHGYVVMDRRMSPCVAY